MRAVISTFSYLYISVNQIATHVYEHGFLKPQLKPAMFLTVAPSFCSTLAPCTFFLQENSSPRHALKKADRP